MKKIILWAVIALGCSAGGRVIERPALVDSPTEATPESGAVTVSETAPARGLAESDPFSARLKRFESAYREMVCKLNRNYDPTSSVGTLVEPCAEIKRLVAEKSKSLDVCVAILERHGYRSVEEFFKDREHIELAQPKWFKELSGSLFDILETCYE